MLESPHSLERMASSVAAAAAAVPVSNSTMSDPASSFSTKPKKSRKRWLCDVCKVKNFYDYDECVKHELYCKGPENATTVDPTAAVDPPRDAATASSSDDKDKETLSVETEEKGSPVKRSRTESNDAEQVVEAKKSNKSSAKGSSSSMLHPFFQAGKGSAKGPTKKKAKSANTQNSSDTSNQSNNVKRSKKTNNSSNNSPDENTLNAFFQGPEQFKALQQAQRVAEFQAKRRRQAELERERRLKRQKQQQQQQSSTQATTPEPRRASLGYAAFPVPTHVVPETTDEANSSYGSLVVSPNAWWNEGQAQRCREALTRHFPWCTRPLALGDEESLDQVPFVWNAKSTTSHCEATLETPCDWLLQALSALFVPSATKPSQESIQPDYHELSPAGRALAQFIEKWKEIREESHRRMMERNRKLAGRRLKKTAAKPSSRKSKKYEDDEEDWFMDGSDSDEEDEAMTSLFLLTGPVGVGKTSLVYQVAEQAQCGVLEVNTSEVRGSAALRKRIQDATQTHSAKWNKKAGGIASAFAKQEANNAASQQDESESAALMIILLDEVDLLYPENGDNGFWNALSDVSKKSKAPIILTANQFPTELLSSAFRFEHESVEPSIDQCAIHLLSLANQQGLQVRPDRAEFAKQDAARIAYLAQGDCRKISFAIQALKAATNAAASPANPRIQLLSSIPAEPCRDSTPDCISQISRLQPLCVPADEMSLITLTGEGFLAFADPSSCLGSRGGYPVKVFVGRLECSHARILDDSTILAVCPPILGKGQGAVWVDSSDLDMRYARVSICSSRSLGIGSTTDGAVQHTELHDGTPFSTLRPSTLLEYKLYPAVSDENDEEDSDEECEFEDSAAKKASPNACQSAVTVDRKAALQLLKEGMDAWLSQKHDIPQVDEDDDFEDDEGLAQIERLCRAVAYESDAAFLEDCGLEGLPMLAGGCIPYETNEKSNVLQFQRAQKKESDSWLCGGNSFVVTPSPREGRLLRRMRRELRGTSLLFAEVEDEEEETASPKMKEEPDDDALLPRPVPNSLLELPGYMRTVAKSPVAPIRSDISFSRRRNDKLKRQIDLLESYTFAFHRADVKSFFCGLNRQVDVLLDPGDSFDSRLVLDYLPLLRRMAIMERATDCFFKEQQDVQIASSLSNRSRSTRSSSKKGREHYFETAFEYLRTLDDSEQVNQVGNSFCQGFLSYY